MFLVLISETARRKESVTITRRDNTDLSAIQHRQELADKDVGRSVLFNCLGLVGCVIEHYGVEAFCDLIHISLHQHTRMQHKAHHIIKAELKASQGVGDSVVELDLVLSQGRSPTSSLVLIFLCEHFKESRVSVIVTQIGLLQPLGVGVHHMRELTLGGSLLKLGEVRQIDLTGLHLNAEETSRSALSDVGSKLCRHDNVALRRTSLAQGDLGSQTIAGGSVTVTSCHRLHNGFHTLTLLSACGVVVIHAGQHVLEGEGTVCDTVGGITEAHREVGCREAAEEGGHQRGDRAFHTACSSEQGENKFRLVSDLTEEFIQRREEHKREARIGDLHRDKVEAEEPCKLGVIEILDVGIKEVPLLLSLKLNVVSSDAGHQIFPLAIHLLPPCKGEDGFLCGKPCRAFHRVAHVLFHLGDDLKIEGGIKMVV